MLILGYFSRLVRWFQASYPRLLCPLQAISSRLLTRFQAVFSRLLTPLQAVSSRLLCPFQAVCSRLPSLFRASTSRLLCRFQAVLSRLFLSVLGLHLQAIFSTWTRVLHFYLCINPSLKKTHYIWLWPAKFFQIWAEPSWVILSEL